MPSSLSWYSLWILTPPTNIPSSNSGPLDNKPESPLRLPQRREPGQSLLRLLPNSGATLYHKYNLNLAIPYLLSWMRRGGVSREQLYVLFSCQRKILCNGRGTRRRKVHLHDCVGRRVGSNVRKGVSNIYCIR